MRLDRRCFLLGSTAAAVAAAFRLPATPKSLFLDLETVVPGFEHGTVYYTGRYFDDHYKVGDIFFDRRTTTMLIAVRDGDELRWLPVPAAGEIERVETRC